MQQHSLHKRFQSQKIFFLRRNFKTYTEQKRGLEQLIERFSKQNRRAHRSLCNNRCREKHKHLPVLTDLPPTKQNFLQLWRPWSLELGCPVVLWKQAQPAPLAEEARSYIAGKGLAKQPPPRNSSGYKTISRRLRVAWCKVLERREQAEEAAEAEDLGNRIVIGEGSCAQLEIIFFFLSVLFFRHTLGEQRAHLLECMHQHKVAIILHYEAAAKSIPPQLALCGSASYKCIHLGCALPSELLSHAFSVVHSSKRR
jgi:hypothetical protein